MIRETIILLPGAWPKAGRKPSALQANIPAVALHQTSNNGACLSSTVYFVLPISAHAAVFCSLRGVCDKLMNNK